MIKRKEKKEEFKIGEIYKVKDDFDTYIRIIKPEYSTSENIDFEKYVYAETIPLYVNSLFGVIIQKGWIEKDKLIPLTKKEKNRIQKIEQRVIEKGIERSSLWYKVYKAKAEILQDMKNWDGGENYGIKNQAFRQ